MISAVDIVHAQSEWAAVVVSVGRLMDNRPACIAAAEEAVDRFYAFDISEVLFKPTRAERIPFRKSRAGAISYFIGGNPDFPEDNGFALRPWKDVRFENAIHHLQGDRACAMGHYYFTDFAGEVLKVEYTFGYMTAPDGTMRICLHHSSMPFRS